MAYFVANRRYLGERVKVGGAAKDAKSSSSAEAVALSLFKQFILADARS